ncbi:peptidoglycan-binding protein [Fusobacterium hominis]|uniref:peptidoglycan-binding protein n=1 Tax=Fusobacterium hominis TaxID=2764326 RepID=UPI0022DFFCA2|nr:peptidoglycan-binding protein [Fusobacterium hominis]
MKPTFILLNPKTFVPFIFVVPPLDLEISTEQQIKSVNLIQFGEYIKAGERNCKSISFSSFFPGVNSVFYKPFENPMIPLLCVQTLELWKNKKDELTLVIPEFAISEPVFIERFTHTYDERTGDINFSINLREKRYKGKIIQGIGLIG